MQRHSENPISNTDALVELDQYECQAPTSENPAKRPGVSRKAAIKLESGVRPT